MDSGEDCLLQQDGSPQAEQHPFAASVNRISKTSGSNSPAKIIGASTTEQGIELSKLQELGYKVYSGNVEDDFLRSLKERHDQKIGLDNGTGGSSSNKINGRQLTDNLHGPDELHRISIASLYDRDLHEMDTDRYDSPSIANTPDKRKAVEPTEPNIIPNITINDINDNRQTIEVDETTSQHSFNTNATISSSLFMNDGIRSVDYVLAWECSVHRLVEKTNRDKRKVYEDNLINQGLEIELEKVEHDLNFVKIHAPLDLLRRYAEILKLRMPMKEIPGLCARNTPKNIYSKLKGFGASILDKILVDQKHFPQRSQHFTAIYSRDKEYLFDCKKEKFFTAAVRSRIVQFILDRQKFSPGGADDFAFGIERLVSSGVYLAGYPLHDGDVTEEGSLRCRLYNEWASVKKWYRYQPLDYIKDYFGVKIGLYFAWLGFYTYMLLLASIVGVICFLYSYLTLDSNKPTNEICAGDPEFKMCPLCDDWCDYWDLKETCFYAKITYLIDNPTTVYFAVFMSFWATLFLELWKRYSAEITHRWDLTGFDVHEEHPRPQYLARLAHVRKMRIDYVTNTKEPQPPFWRMKLPATVFSFSVVLLLILLAFAAVLAVVLYRMSILAALTVYGDRVNTSSAIMITTGTAACINLCMIFLFNYIYTFLAEFVTELELLRTQTEFDDSITLKIYLLQFVNYYASIFYIAFFKGKFVGHPGAYNRLFTYRQEECSSGGCLTELGIQLAIIMIGKQALNSIMEMIMPIFWKWVNMMQVGLFSRKKSRKKKKGERWLRDLKLVEWGPRSLFPEYLEMVLQYGFVTIFVSAFPLAPLFALLNNILEMRLDAKKLLTYYRRPVSQRVKDIGVWYRILDCIGKLSVITNGFIIAFTSDLIPRLVYVYTQSKNGTLDGYLEYSMASFNTTELERKPDNSSQNVGVCRYVDFRSSHMEPQPIRYRLTSEYYFILACRLVFIVLFENFVALVMILVGWCIPDMSTELRDQIRREAYITNEIIIKQETLRARAERAVRDRGCSYNPDDPIESDISYKKMERLMSSKLSQSELDLVMHGPEDLTAPRSYRPNGQHKVTLETADTGPVSV